MDGSKETVSFRLNRTYTYWNYQDCGTGPLKFKQDGVPTPRKKVDIYFIPKKLYLIDS